MTIVRASHPQHAAQLAEQVGGRLIGDATHMVTGVAPLHRCRQGDLSFCTDLKRSDELSTAHGAVVLVNEALAAHVVDTAIVVSDPYLGYAKLAASLCPPKALPASIHPSACVAGASVQADVYIGPNVVIGAGSEIASGTRIAANTVIGENVRIGIAGNIQANVTIHDNVVIGARCYLESGCVIGSRGFGNARDGEAWFPIPQLGTVIIGDDVEVGANTCIDRGAIDDTLLGNGVKLDNQIQIAHNVEIGDHTVMAGCVGIAGSVKIGKRCQFAGMASMAGHLEACDDVVLLGNTMATKSITEPGVYSAGWSAKPVLEWHKNLAKLHRLIGNYRPVKKSSN